MLNQIDHHFKTKHNVNVILFNNKVNNEKTDSTRSKSTTKKKRLSFSKLTEFTKSQVNRGKVAIGIVNTIAGGYKAISKIEGWQEPKRDNLPRYINAFSRKVVGVFGVTVIEVEKVPKTNGLWVSNHISWLDIPVVGVLSPIFFVSKTEVQKIPFFGKLAKAAGTLFINRGSGDAGSVAEQIANFLTQGYSVLFCPEATTSDGKGIKKLHGKLLQSAIDANKPIQPLVLCYVNKCGELEEAVNFIDGMPLLRSLLSVIDSDPITAYVLPLQTLTPAGKTREELTSELQSVLQSGLERLHKTVLTTHLEPKSLDLT